MKPSLQKLELDGAMLARGFWLYVWEVTKPDREIALYVGRTGDSSSCNAQSPFTRFGQHLGTNAKANALLRHLQKSGVDAESCKLCSFKLVAYGPIFPEQSTMGRHKQFRDRTAGLEKGLCDALRKARYKVLNQVHSRQPHDPRHLLHLIKAFASDFPKLKG